MSCTSFVFDCNLSDSEFNCDALKLKHNMWLFRKLIFNCSLFLSSSSWLGISVWFRFVRLETIVLGFLLGVSVRFLFILGIIIAIRTFNFILFLSSLWLWSQIEYYLIKGSYVNFCLSKSEKLCNFRLWNSVKIPYRIIFNIPFGFYLLGSSQRIYIENLILFYYVFHNMGNFMFSIISWLLFHYLVIIVPLQLKYCRQHSG